MHRLFIATIALAIAATPFASAHGALTLNEFDTYAISDFEGHEDSFAWEGFEIWDVYAGDGYHQPSQSHGVYFKVNFAGDGTLRPTGSQAWTVDFRFTVGNASYERSLMHDGAEVSHDFDELEWQIADGNVFQIMAWVAIDDATAESIEDLTLVSSVDGSPRDTAPGGIHDPITGAEIPVNVPPTPVFPEMGEGRIVPSVPLTGAEKFLDVDLSPAGGDAFSFTVTNPLAEQGQHFMFHADANPAWTIHGAPAPVSLNASDSMTFDLHLVPDAGTALVAPLMFHLMSDIGGLQTYYAVATAEGVVVTQDATQAAAYEGAQAETTPAVPGLLAVALAAFVVRRRME